MTIALVNRFAPPDPSPTAAALARLAALLTARAPGLDLRFIGTGRTYDGGGAAGEGALRRAAASWRDGGRLAQAAQQCAAVVSLTDPPFLAHRIARRLPADRLWVEWTMDLYPAALQAALGFPPRPANPYLRRFFIAGRRRPDLRLCLGPEQAAFLAAGDPAPVPYSTLPAGVCDAPAFHAFPPAPRLLTADDRIRLVYAGNLGRAHWAGALPLLARACDPTRFHLTVAAYGRRAGETRKALAGFPHVDLRASPLTDAELNAADVHVVSLRDAWTHVCVPSKAVAALCRGRPILFFGSARSDAWGWTHAAGAGAGAGAGAENGAETAAGLRIDPCPRAAADALPEVLTQLSSAPRLAALTAAARAAGDRLRRTEDAAVDALVERFIRLPPSLNV